MRNYLFAPFKDDDDKIQEFNGVISALKYVVDAEDTHLHESALHGLRVFMGRLESYYDVIIGKLGSENAVAVADERVIKGLEDKVAELKAELMESRKKCRMMVNKADELKGKVKELKADIFHDSKVCDDYDDGLLTEIEELKAEIKELKENASKYLREDASKIEELKAEIKHFKSIANDDFKIVDDDRAKLQAENKELKYELKHKAIKVNTKHYPKEYKEEAKEYFSHNPNGEKLWFFMVGDSEVDEDGDIRKTLNVGVDAIAECDNLNGDVSVEVYK
jgi:uncharacterized coiled-coil protein SlyX